MKFITRQSIKENLKKLNLQFVSMAGSAFTPWDRPNLNDYLKYCIYGGQECISVTIDEDDRCPFLTPDCLPRSCFRSAVYNHTSIHLDTEFSLHEGVECSVFDIRNASDVCHRIPSLFKISYNPSSNELVLKVQGDCRNSVQDIYSGEKIKMKVLYTGGILYCSINGAEYSYDLSADEYWFNYGLIDSEKKKFNNMLIHSFDLSNEASLKN